MNNRLDLLLPFALPPSELAADLTRSLTAPCFATLLARSKSVTSADMDAFARALPHENWLARQSGLVQNDASNSPPLAPVVMQAMGIAPASGFWFFLQPAHLHVARDHLVLTDIAKLDLTEDESRVLFHSIQELFEEGGKTLVYGDAQTWFLRADDWAELLTSTPGAASGHNIDIWMPRGPQERAWRKLLNEAQMTWHAHPMNADREMRNRLPVNSLWLWGGGREHQHGVQSAYQQVFNPIPWMNPSVPLPKSRAAITDVLDSSAQHVLVIRDELIDSAMASDWSTWLDAMHRLEKDWMVPLLDALRTGRIGEIRMILSHSTKLLEVASGKNSVKKFWIKPSLATLSR